MIDGVMQEFALTLEKFLDHAAKWHPRGRVVTAREQGRIDRVDYAELRTCRWDYLVNAFGKDDVAGEHCGHCDRCAPERLRHR